MILSKITHFYIILFSWIWAKRLYCTLSFSMLHIYLSYEISLLMYMYTWLSIVVISFIVIKVLNYGIGSISFIYGLCSYKIRLLYALIEILRSFGLICPKVFPLNQFCYFQSQSYRKRIHFFAETFVSELNPAKFQGHQNVLEFVL